MQLLHYVTAALIVMRHAEGDAAYPFRPVVAPGSDLLRLHRGLDHWHRDAHPAGVEDRRHEVIMAPGTSTIGTMPRPREAAICILIVSMPTPLCSVSSSTKSAPASASIAIRPGAKDSRAILL